jgi:hypothetical protein
MALKEYKPGTASGVSVGRAPGSALHDRAGEGKASARVA